MPPIKDEARVVANLCGGTKVVRIASGSPDADAAEGGNYRELKVEDVLAYLEQVKTQFIDSPHVYCHFLNIMKGFKAQTLDTTDVVEHVSHTFCRHHELILGFRIFLPSWYSIELREDPRGDDVAPAGPAFPEPPGGAGAPSIQPSQNPGPSSPPPGPQNGPPAAMMDVEPGGSAAPSGVSVIDAECLADASLAALQHQEMGARQRANPHPPPQQLGARQRADHHPPPPPPQPVPIATQPVEQHEMQQQQQQHECCWCGWCAMQALEQHEMQQQEQQQESSGCQKPSSGSASAQPVAGFGSPAAQAALPAVAGEPVAFDQAAVSGEHAGFD